LPLNAQDIDSLYTVYSQAKGAEQIRPANEICALAFRREIVNEEWTFSQSSKAEQIRARVLYCMSSFAAAKGDYQKAIAYIEKGLSIDERLNDKPMVAADYRILATIYDRLNRIDKVVSCFDKSIGISSSIGDEKSEAETLYQLGMFYLRKNRNEVGIQTIEKVLSIARRIDHRKLIANSLGSIGEYHLQHGDADKAIEAVSQSLEVCRQIGTPKYLEAGLCRLGMAQMKTGEYGKAEANLLEALEMTKQMEDKYPTAFDLMVLGDLKREQKMYREADAYYVQSVNKCLELQNYSMLSVIYDKLYQLHRRNNPVLSLEWLEKGILVDDSLYNLEMHNQISAFQIEYETEKKETQIAALEGEKRLMIWLGIAGGAVLLLALAAFFFLWRWTVQKKRLAESQIKQLEQEKQLIATQSVLDGEVQERIRLARDLHDGLGSILAATKYNLLDIKQISTLGEKDVEHYNMAVCLLDDSMNEMRRVAHHLAPEPLSRIGLKQSVADFCNTIPIVKFSYYGDEARFDPKLEVMVYRILHELVSNAMKHAKAEHILVQLVRDKDGIALTVSDDGCGFDLSAESKGMGLRNIRARVESFKGNLDIDSQPGKGTEIYVEFKL
jgi:signal transduction histidine kinase/Tfp pilus assembly protein PilF